MRASPLAGEQLSRRGAREGRCRYDAELPRLAGEARRARDGTTSAPITILPPRPQLR